MRWQASSVVLAHVRRGVASVPAWGEGQHPPNPVMSDISVVDSGNPENTAPVSTIHDNNAVSSANPDNGCRIYRLISTSNVVFTGYLESAN